MRVVAFILGCASLTTATDPAAAAPAADAAAPAAAPAEAAPAPAEAASPAPAEASSSADQPAAASEEGTNANDSVRVSFHIASPQHMHLGNLFKLDEELRSRFEVSLGESAKNFSSASKVFVRLHAEGGVHNAEDITVAIACSADSADALAKVREGINFAVHSGGLRDATRTAIAAALNKTASQLFVDEDPAWTINSIKINEFKTLKWSEECSKHTESVLSSLAKEYTQASLKAALANECETFGAKSSFNAPETEITVHEKWFCETSIDEVLFGKQAATAFVQSTRILSPEAPAASSEAPNVEGWCLAVCEHKFGKGSAECGGDSEAETEAATEEPAAASDAGSAPAETIVV